MTTNKLKRYHATLSIYIYAKDDNDAKNQLKSLCKELDDFHDNSCRPTELIENPYGTFTPSDKNLLDD